MLSRSQVQTRDILLFHALKFHALSLHSLLFNLLLHSPLSHRLSCQSWQLSSKRIYRLFLLGTAIFTQAIALFFAASAVADTNKDEAKVINHSAWQSLFNGKNLDGWTAKFTGYPAGTNYQNTFRVENGLLTVNYQNWTTFSQDTFGHLFTDKAYSHYKLRVQYRFIGKQITQDKKYAWAYRNNGLMLHAQAPESMAIDQLFPVSVEAQLLGGDGTHTRSTANVCTPSTHIIIDSTIIRQHCINSSSPTYHGDQWVWFEAEVNQSGEIKHWVNGKLVFEYKGLQIDKNDPWGKKWLANGGPINLNQGHIAIQAETHPIQFKRIEIKAIQ